MRRCSDISLRSQGRDVADTLRRHHDVANELSWILLLIKVTFTSANVKKEFLL